jgi:hypothetical protein
MRLTLRTLLAYVDDTLSPDQAREIGQKVAESTVAQELMERIKKVTRRRGLTVPPAAGPERIDANTVAEYLDNDLPADHVAEVEEMALNSDVHLAEIAACHQILTLVLGEPAHVPPTARERMYGLVKGKESEPHRRASRIGPPPFPGDAEDADELADASRGVGYRLLGACVLVAALAVAVWQSLSRRPAPVPPPPVDGPNVVAVKPEPKADQTPPEPAPKPVDSQPATPPADKTEPPPQPKPMTPPENKSEPPPQPQNPPPNQSASTEKKDVGQFSSKDALLLAEDSNTWTNVPSTAKVRTAASLLALPGSHAEIDLDSGARLTLWGGLPDTTGWTMLDCVATLHVPPVGFDLDFTLDGGRAFVGTTKKNGPTKVRIRVAEQVIDATLADEKSELLVQAVRLFAGQPVQRDAKGLPPTQATLAVVQGKAQVAVGTKEFALREPPGPADLHWPGDGKPIELDAPPAAWSKNAIRALPRERQQEIEAAQKKFVQRAGEKSKPINLAVAELGQDPNRAARTLATLSLGSLGLLPQLVDDLNEPQSADVRLAAAAALAHYIARQVGNDATAFEQFRKTYGDRWADVAMWLLHGFNEVQSTEPATYSRLIEALRADPIGVRELAAWRLRQADPEGAAQIRFNAGEPEPARERAVADWLRRIPPGKVPPRNNPQGRAPGRPPSRG